MSQKKTIFIIDDDDDIRETTKEVLETEGYHVLTAENGEIALEMLLSLETLPHLILLDFMMPVMDGLQFLKEVETKHLETIGKVPIVLASAKGSVKTLPEHHLMLERLRKPMDIEDLFRIAERYCS